MLKIDEITIISDKIIIVQGSSSSDIRLTRDNCRLQNNGIRYPVKKVISTAPSIHSSQIELTIKFKVLCHVEPKTQVSEYELIFHALDKTYQHCPVYLHSIKSYLTDLYSRDENDCFYKTEDILNILESINDEGIKVFSYTNTSNKQFGLIKLANNDGGCSSLYISKVSTLADQPPTRSVINCPIGKSSLKRVFETNTTSTITIIQHTESGNHLDLSYDFISKRKAYTLIIKKLSRSQRADKNYDFIRMVKHITQLWNPVQRASLVNQYDQAQNSKSSGNYKLFINEFEPKIEAELSRALRNLDYERQPLISIITPLQQHTSKNTLLELLGNILNQEYQNWEWILIDDCKLDEKAHIQELIKNDTRIKLVKPEKEADAIQIGLQLAYGELISFCNHDALLSSFALTAIVIAYSNHPKAKWFFADEDVISSRGVRSDPKLKSVFNPELLKSKNHINHFSVFKKELLNQIDSIQLSQHDFYLELISKLKADEIIHIPFILYHCRHKEHSTSSDIHIHSSRMELKLSTRTDIHKSVLVSIIIPFKDNADLLENCIASIYNTCKEDSFELVLVNNGSTQPEMIELLSILNKKNEISIIKDESDFNFSKLINIGASKAKGDCLLLMNNDVEAIEPGWLEELRDLAMVESTGCVGCKLLYSDFTIQHVGMSLGSGGYVAHSYRGKERDFSDDQDRLKGRFNVSSVTAAVLAVRKEVFDQVGGFDENYRIEYNDVDFNLRVFDAGYWNICTCFAELIHFESKTRGRNITPEKKATLDKEKKRFIKNWGKYIKDDPFFHPLLTRMRDDHSFADPHEWKIDYSTIIGRKLEIKEHSVINQFP